MGARYGGMYVCCCICSNLRDGCDYRRSVLDGRSRNESHSEEPVPPESQKYPLDSIEVTKALNKGERCYKKTLNNME